MMKPNIEDITNNAEYQLQKQSLSALEKTSFNFSNEKVQGALIASFKQDGAVYNYIISPRRFKLSTASSDLILIKSGEGAIKWSRGEKSFAAYSFFLACGEYEISGNCEFIIKRG